MSAPRDVVPAEPATQPTAPASTGIAAGAESAPVARSGPQVFERLRASRTLRAGLLAALVYLIGALAMTWPLATDLDGSLPGLAGDSVAQTYQLRELIQEGMTPFSPGDLEDLAAPEGMPNAYATSVASWSGQTMKWVLALVFGSVVAVNVFVLLGYVLNGTVMFLFVRRQVGDWRVALVGGWAFAFFPYFVIKALGHYEQAHGWPLVLLLWAAVAVRERPTRRRAVALGAAVVVACAFTPYLLLIAAVMYGTLALWDLACAWRDKDLVAHLKAHAVAVGMLGAAVVVYGLVAVTASSSGGALRSHSIGELTAYSARPLNYLVPGPDSPVAGGLAAGYWKDATRSVGLIEVLVYVGITVLVLALFALWHAVRGRLVGDARRLAFGAAAVAIVAAAFSGPPFLQAMGVTIRMPSWFVFQVTSTWRVYSRFGALVMVGVVVLAALGLKALLKDRSPAAGWALVSVVGLLVVVDLWGRPAVTRVELPRDPIYATLAKQGPGIVAEYPIMGAEIPEYGWALNQDLHDHPVMNGFGARTPEEQRAFWLADLTDPNVAARLSLLGVRYVVAHNYVPPMVTDPGTPRRGFEAIGESPAGRLYRVSAPPAAAFVWPSLGFSSPEGKGDDKGAWLVEASGSLGVRARCGACGGTLRFEALSFEQPRRLTFSAGGRSLRTVEVGPEPVELSVPVPRAGSDALEVAVTPPPQPAPDGRSLAVWVSDLEFTPSG